MLPSRLQRFWKRARGSAVVKNSSFYALNQLSLVVFQLGYFIIISRAFGPGGYGIFSSLSATALMVSVFVGWGSERVLIQRVAVDPSSFRDLYGSALVLHLLTVLPLSLIAFGILIFLEHGDLSWFGLLLLVVAECGFRKLTILGLCSFFAHEMAIKHWIYDINSQFLRLLFAYLASVFADPLTLDAWALWYVAGSGLGALVVIVAAAIDLGKPRFSFHFPDLRLGFLYSIEMGSVTGMRDLDKPAVVETLGAESGGIYTAAFRLITAAASPLRGMLLATYTRFFRHADKGVGHGISFGLKILPYVTVVSLGVSGCLFIGAGFIPWILGEKYAEVAHLVRIMSFYPLILGAFGVGADLMRAIGLQGLRVLLIGLSSIAVIPIIWVGAHLGGLIGAVIARMALDAVLAAISWRIVQIKRSATAPKGEPVEAAAQP